VPLDKRNGLRRPEGMVRECTPSSFYLRVYRPMRIRIVRVAGFADLRSLGSPRLAPSLALGSK